MNIKIGDIYDYYDDGKIRESRRSEVKITSIVEFKDIDLETLELWKEEVEECYWLYSKQTDYFIKADLLDGENQEVTFARSLNNGWFSLGFWAGRLDTTNQLKNNFEN